MNLESIETQGGTIAVRKTFAYTEVVFREVGRGCSRPIKRAVVGAVLSNPYAGTYDENLEMLQDAGGAFGRWASTSALSLLDGDVRAYGKGGVVGSSGEIEHVAALLHPKFGSPTREVLQGVSLLPSVKKRGHTGCSIDIPVHHVKAMRVRDYFDAITVAIPDAPLSDEILVMLAVTNGPRPLARMGGLAEADAVGLDGVN